MLGRITDDTLEKVRKNFTLDEIAALQDPALTLPDTLPALTPVMRARIAETLKRAAGGEGRTSGDQGGGGRAGALRVVPEYAGPALELACAVTERVEATNPVHRLPLQAAISHLLGRADAARDLPGQEVERLALEIARDRKALEAKITLAPRYTTHRRASCLIGLFGHVCRHANSAFSGLWMIHLRRASSPVRNHDFVRRLWLLRRIAVRPMTRVAQR